MAEFLAIFENAIGAVTKFNDYVLTPIMRQFSYLYCYNSNIQGLRDQVEKLNGTKSDLQLQVDEANNISEVIGHDVSVWLEKAVKLNEKLERIIQDTAQVQRGCFYGSCPNMKLRYRLSREAKKTTEAAAELLQDYSKFHKISYRTKPEPIPTASAGVEVDSRKSKEDVIMDALKDEKVYVIAVCGMGGVGKTTMVKKIENRVREVKIFEEVVMAVVSRELDLHQVQQGIAEGLGLTFSEQTIPARAKRLHKRLKDAKSVLIILDDVWEKFNLQEIGIPSKTTHEGCKIILTSRNQQVCRNIDDSAIIIQLDVLSEQEAWNLFKEKAGEIVQDPYVLPTAMDVAKECRGLPLALVTVAAALRTSSVPCWNDALLQLKGSTATAIPEVYDEVYVPLKWSYDQLRSEEARYLFLLCSLFPEDYEIPLDTLVKYGFGLRIFANIENLTQARNRVYKLVEMLIDRFMLIRSSISKAKNHRVKMHDVIRDVAISITSKDFMVSHNQSLREWPKNNFDDNYTSISLSSRNRISLPEKIYCPRLELLRMHFAEGTEIQESFLAGMRGLKVLHTFLIEPFPSPFPLLTNLRSLLLGGNEVKILPKEIGELVNLEILSLEKSRIEMLPMEIGRLKNLKSLDLTDCWTLKYILPGVISRLVQLEELFMMRSFKNWEAEENNASVAEVASLTNLTTLEIEMPSLRSINIPEDSRNWHKLMRYYVVIGDSYYDKEMDFLKKSLHDFARSFELTNVQDFERCIKLTNFGSPVPLMPEVEVLFENAEVVELKGDGCSEIENKLSREGYPNVKILVMKRLNTIEFLFDSISLNLLNSGFLSRATTLDLSSNNGLKEICRGQPPTGSFSNLTSIKLDKCNGMQYLFSFSIVAMLSKLEFLHIQRCKIMEAVFYEQNGQFGINAISTITFPKLSEIRLEGLPRLGAFCKATDHVAIELPQLSNMEVEDCWSLKSFCNTESCTRPGGDDNAEQQFFFDQKVMCSGLGRLSLRKCGKFLIFDPRIPIGNFTALGILTLEECSDCVNLFSSSISRAMINLKVLQVRTCGMLQEVIAKDVEEQTSSKVTLFLQLKELNLTRLPKMQQFCHMSHGIELPSLEFLEIYGCRLMDTFSRKSVNLLSSGVSDSNLVVKSFFDEVTCSKLKMLILSYNQDATELFSHKLSNIGNFSGLQTVQISNCNRLQSIFSPPLSRSLMNLQVIMVDSCSELQEVISEKENEPLFPQLKKVVLEGLSKLVRFCHIKDDFELPSLETVTIQGCSMLTCFYTISEGDHDVEKQFILDPKVIRKGLKELSLEGISCEIGIFDPKIPIGNFMGLESLRLVHCSHLVNLFSDSISKAMINLKDLYVSLCVMLEEVIAKDVEEQTSSKVTLFPRLETLILFGLPKMQQFCHLSHGIELPSLEYLEIEDCQHMNTFSRNQENVSSLEVFDSNHSLSSFFDQVTCSKLKTLKLSDIDTVRELFDRKCSIDNFGRLKFVVINGCKRLRSIFSPSMSRGLLNLKVLRVKRCPELQEVISVEERDSEKKIKETLFPQLWKLVLRDLPKLIRFCSIKDDLELPSLSVVVVKKCPLLETFSLGKVHLPKFSADEYHDLGIS